MIDYLVEDLDYQNLQGLVMWFGAQLSSYTLGNYPMAFNHYNPIEFLYDESPVM